MTLPGVTPVTAHRIVTARAGRNGWFKDWDDLRARKKAAGIGEDTIVRIEESGLAYVWHMDPVTYLPGDVAALLLSFLSIRTLLCSAQLVNHAWQEAIDGGLPAVWFNVRLGYKISDTALSVVAQKSRGQVRELEVARMTSRGLSTLPSFSDLRVLSITASYFFIYWYVQERPPSAILSSLPLLERFSIDYIRTGSIDQHKLEIAFPPMRFLQTVCCIECRIVKCLHNLPSLTKLQLERCCVGADDIWFVTSPFSNISFSTLKSSNVWLVYRNSTH